MNSEKGCDDQDSPALLDRTNRLDSIDLYRRRSQRHACDRGSPSRLSGTGRASIEATSEAIDGTDSGYANARPRARLVVSRRPTSSLPTSRFPASEDPTAGPSCRGRRRWRAIRRRQSTSWGKTCPESPRVEGILSVAAGTIARRWTHANSLLRSLARLPGRWRLWF
jgi:hypothetical protein